ncbi:hypothetical protein KYE0_004053 [Paenibacillus thiaminolyticus]|nr:hypothetical protein [Paenibacillus thiaminolyticus]CAH8715756.1 hypothetical protein KYE0_004053 [Paenibacillus thiaminolyticus]
MELVQRNREQTPEQLPVQSAQQLRLQRGLGHPVQAPVSPPAVDDCLHAAVPLQALDPPFLSLIVLHGEPPAVDAAFRRLVAAGRAAALREAVQHSPQEGGNRAFPRLIRAEQQRNAAGLPRLAQIELQIAQLAEAVHIQMQQPHDALPPSCSASSDSSIASCSQSAAASSG